MERTMKLPLLPLAATLALTLAACQSDMTGTPRAITPNASLTPCPADPHANIPVGDAYFETMLGRYHPSQPK